MHLGMTLCCWVAPLLAMAATAPTDNPVAGFYGTAGYATWTDQIKWQQVFHINDYGGGAAKTGTENFTAFEKARDAAYAAGGGVVYFPAGTYNITLPDAGDGSGDGPNGRGLMLKSGVVIRGDEPNGDKWARPNGSFTKDGELDPPTKLKFEFRKRKDFAGKETDKTFPKDWNFIGMVPGGKKSLKDVSNIGVCWVELIGATVFWGPEATWTTYATGTFFGSFAKTGWPAKGPKWSSRQADGTHPGDVFCGSKGDYKGSGNGRLVFGVKLTDAVVMNDFYLGAGNGPDGKQDAFWAYRFCGRIAAYGSDVLIANTTMPKSANNFVYKQWTKLNSLPRPTAARDILFDYGHSIGIDVNKNLLGLAKPSAPGAGYYMDNVVIRDNYVYGRGDKGFDICGRFIKVYDNFNDRCYYGYTMPPGYPNAGGKIESVTMDGYITQTVDETATDFMSRGFDVGGRYLWLGNNKVCNTGSVGNDGEAFMGQRMNNMDIYSWAMTDNKQYNVDNGPGTSGEPSWLGSWAQEAFGFLLLRNETTGFQGWIYDSNNSYHVLDMTAAPGGVRPGKETKGIKPPADFDNSCHTDKVAAPTGVNATMLENNKGVKIDWKDESKNELGFRIERRLSGKEWKTIAYHAARNRSAEVKEKEAYSTTPISELNLPIWVDYEAPAGVALEYRVVAFNAKDDASTGVSEPSKAVTLQAAKPAAAVP